MELYHIHMRGTKDKMYIPGKEIIVNDTFNNKLYECAYNSSYTATRDDFPYLFKLMDMLHEYMNLYPIGKQAPFSELLDCLSASDMDKVPEIERLNVLKESFTMLRRADLAKRELAMEEFRKDAYPNIPSRMHCLYACNEQGLEYWTKRIPEQNIEVLRIDPMEEPFHTNEQLLPDISLSYNDTYDASKRYFRPKEKDINTETDEFLVKGRVKILEKIY